MESFKLEKKSKNSWSWKIDPKELQTQVENYNTLKITESYRGIASLLILFSVSITILLSFFNLVDINSVIAALVIYLPIAFFVFKGHKWAIYLILVLWTLEKGFQLYQISLNGTGIAIT